MNLVISENIKEKLNNLPDKPGVYLFKDKKGEIVYIGKAKVLKHRVRSYFQAGRPYDPKLQRLQSRVADLETIITDSEVEALILEANLIKEHKPRYNINLKDDKSFPYIRVTKESFPRIFPTRQIVRDGSRYFGPYTDVTSMRELLKTIKRLFPIRSCNLHLTDETIAKKKFQVCLDYHLKRCYGPCEGLVSREEYNQVVEFVVSFIEGRSQKVVEDIRTRMEEMAARLNFEAAARLRDQLKSIEQFQLRQKVVDQSLADRDVIAIAGEEGDSCSVVFKIRDGKIVGRQHFYLDGTEEESLESVTSAFIKQYYLKADYIPGEIFLPVKLGEDTAAVQNWLQQKRQDRVTLTIPQRGEKSQLLKMCLNNARLLLQELKLQKLKSADYVAGSVKALQNDLKMTNPPKRIEAFDISNIQGTDPVASMVCFVNGKALKSDYRRFRIQTKSTPDDFAMMREAVGRRYTRLLKEKSPLPDLILIDGGKGQLSAALEALGQIDIKEQPVIALAKRLDEVFVPGIPDPQNIRRDSSGLKLLQRIRDEAHRFAVTYHRKLRKKRTLKSALESVPGIGPAKRNLLIKALGSIAKVKSANVNELVQIDGISQKLAEQIWHHFHS
jgi:excinuclease ABC subunit C